MCCYLVNVLENLVDDLLVLCYRDINFAEQYSKIFLKEEENVMKHNVISEIITLNVYLHNT